MHPDSIHQRLRILLHILSRLDSQDPAEAPVNLTRESAATLIGFPQTDWLGHETELFRIATAAIAALERHLKTTASCALREQSRWSWEWGSPARSGGAYRTREQAVAAAERSLCPGSVYRLGRFNASKRMEWRAMDCACEEHRAGIPWRALEADQLTRLQSLIDGLVAAFLENEADLPAFMELTDMEECRT